MNSHTQNPSNGLTPFQFKSFQVRVHAEDKGDPWFCAKDVCSILGYANSNDIIKKLCKAKGVSNSYPLHTDGGLQYPTFINEGNLYRLIIKSTKQEAEPFEAWVCDEVLPSIRKTGAYSQALPAPAAQPATTALPSAPSKIRVLTTYENGKPPFSQLVGEGVYVMCLDDYKALMRKAGFVLVPSLAINFLELAAECLDEAKAFPDPEDNGITELPF